jgi:hypothetical protein
MIAGGSESSSAPLAGALAPLAEGADAEARDGQEALEPLEALLRAVVFEWRPAHGGADSARILWMSRSARRSGNSPS